MGVSTSHTVGETYLGSLYKFVNIIAVDVSYESYENIGAFTNDHLNDITMAIMGTSYTMAASSYFGDGSPLKQVNWDFMFMTYY